MADLLNGIGSAIAKTGVWSSMAFTGPQKLCDYADNHTINRGAYTAIWMHMYSLCDHFKTVHVYHVPAHQLEHNPNKACDILCSALLRPYKEAARGGVCTQ